MPVTAVISTAALRALPHLRPEQAVHRIAASVHGRFSIIIITFCLSRRRRMSLGHLGCEACDAKQGILFCP